MPGRQALRARKARPDRQVLPALPDRRERPARKDRRDRKDRPRRRGPPGPPASSIRAVRASCSADDCTIECRADEILLHAHCGARRTPATYPAERTASCRRHGPADNPLIALCAKTASISDFVAAKPVVVEQAVAGDVPRLEFASGCRDAAAGNEVTLRNCMGAEEKARAKLATEWGKFPHAERTRCTELARLGGGMQSYVELITCLEMAEIAKTLPKQ